MLMTNTNCKSYLALLRRYGEVLSHIFTFDSEVPLFNAFIPSEYQRTSPRIITPETKVLTLHHLIFEDADM